MRFVVPIILIAVAAAALSVGSLTVTRADFTFINRGSVNTLDPAQMSYVQDMRVADALWETLTTLHPRTVEAMEGVAYFPPQLSRDGRTYRFTLRPDTRWSNGDPVTASDFVRGWRRAIEPGTSDVYAELIWKHIEGAEEYANWRLETVSVLGLIRQLERGSPIKLETARDALITQTGRAFAAEMGRPIPEPAPELEEGFWAELVDAWESSGRDWRRLGDERLDAHIAEMDSRFSRLGIRVIDDHHLEVHLVRPAAFFLDLTSFAVYAPIHASIDRLRLGYAGRPVADNGVWAYDEQWTKPDYHRNGYPGLITNGAYRLKSWVFKRGMILEANPYYWNAAEVPSKTLESIDVEYQNTAFMLYDQGHVDLLADLGMDYTPTLVQQTSDGLRDDIHPIPSFGTYYYNVNCRPYLPDGRRNPLADARVRRALALSVSKQELVDHVERLGNPVADTIVPPGQIPGYPSPRGLGYDPQRAREELAAAGFPGGAGMPVIELLYNTGADHEVKAQAIKRMWEEQLRIRVALVGKETKTFAEDKTVGRFMVARGGWFGDYMDPTTFLDLVQSENSHNTSGFADPTYDALLAKAADEVDPPRRLVLLSEAERYLMEEQVPIIPLFTYVTVHAWRPQVKGIYPNPRQQFPLRYAYVEGR